MDIPIDDYVLYADDDEDDKYFLQSSFHNLVKNKTLQTVSNGRELLNFLENESPKKGLPCLIILDQNMPVLTGDDVIKKLKSSNKYDKIPLVLFSTSSFPVAIAAEFSVGIEQKPATTQEWETIALQLLKHCEDFKNDPESKNVEGV